MPEIENRFGQKIKKNPENEKPSPAIPPLMEKMYSAPDRGGYGNLPKFLRDFKKNIESALIKEKVDKNVAEKISRRLLMVAKPGDLSEEAIRGVASYVNSQIEAIKDLNLSQRNVLSVITKISALEVKGLWEKYPSKIFYLAIEGQKPRS